MSVHDDSSVMRNLGVYGQGIACWPSPPCAAAAHGRWRRFGVGCLVKTLAQGHTFWLWVESHRWLPRVILTVQNKDWSTPLSSNGHTRRPEKAGNGQTVQLSKQDSFALMALSEEKLDLKRVFYGKMEKRTFLQLLPLFLQLLTINVIKLWLI